MDVLAPDVVAIADGGGVAAAARKPITGAAKLAPLLARVASHGFEVVPATLNGMPGVRLSFKELTVAVSLTVEAGRIVQIYAIANPYKLGRLKSCASAAGGCDPLTNCSMVGGVRSCGACPAGYTGDGESGCRPQLLELAVADGSLEPEFSPAVSSYHLQLSAARERVTITVTASTGAIIEIEDIELASDGVWTSPMLSTGTHTIDVIVTARTGLVTRYSISVERADEN